MKLEPIGNPLDITDAMVVRAQRIHNLRCTHCLALRHVHEMLTAAVDADYTPSDETQRPTCP